MDIVKENTGQLEAIVKIKLTEEDYREQVSKELKNAQKKMQMPGFRPGKVPMGLVNKMYGKSVLVEEVNKILADALYKYIQEEKLNVLGNPLPDDEAAANIDWENQNEFEFQYRLGLSPEFDLELSDDIEVDYHKIKVAKESIDQFIGEARKRHGNMINPGTAEAEDVLYGEFTELDDKGIPKEEGKTNTTNVFISFIKDEAIKSQLIGAKAGSTVDMDILKAVESETEAASMVGLKKEELPEHNPVFRFVIESISRVEPAEMNEEFYKKVAPDKDIKTEEDFRKFVEEQIEMQYQTDVDKHFRNVVSEKLIGITELPLPDSFLKKWLLENNKEELTAEKVEDEFEKAADTFRWQLIENHLIKKYEIEVKPEEVNSELEYFIKAQLAQYGQTDIPQEILDKYVKELGSKQEEVKKVYDHLFEKKLMTLFKDKLKLNEIKMEMDEYVKMVNKKYSPDTQEPDADSEKETPKE